MSVYFHPRMPAPPEHDPKPGKRAFGWLVRYLQYRPPLCPCATCAARFKRLVPSTIEPSPPSRGHHHGNHSSSGDDGAHALSEGLSDETETEEVAYGCGNNSAGLTSARLAVSAWAKDRVMAALEQKALVVSGTIDPQHDLNQRPNVAAARTTVGVGEGKFQVDCAITACASAKGLTHSAASVSVQIALCLAEGAAAQSGMGSEEEEDGQGADQSGSVWDVREQCGVVPAVLADPKLGWNGCATVGVSDALAPFLRFAQRQLQCGVHAHHQERVVEGCESVTSALVPQGPLSVLDALAQLAKGARTAAERVLTASPILNQVDSLPTAADASLLRDTDEATADSRPNTVALGSLAWLNESCDAFERSSSRSNDHAALEALASLAAHSSSSNESSGADIANENLFGDEGSDNTKASAPKTTGKKNGNKAKGNAISEADDLGSASEDAAAAVAMLDGRDLSTLKVPRCLDSWHHKECT